MAIRIYQIEPDEDGWVIRRNMVAAAQCADQSSALQLAFALARGERQRTRDTVVVRIVGIDDIKRVSEKGRSGEAEAACSMMTR